MEVRHLDLWYGEVRALRDVSVDFFERQVSALIGPSGCGKSTLLRCLNRMHEGNREARLTGEVRLGGLDIHGAALPVEALRRRVGMVFQRPNPFPLPVFDNVAYGARVHGQPTRAEAAALVEEALSAVGLWEDLKDRLDAPGTALSLEQQQRLCIARVIANQPEVLLMDEPCAALDPIAAMRVEELMAELGQRYAVVVVTHNLQQAARISARTGYMLDGELVEEGPTPEIFTSPADRRTEDFVSGRLV